MKHFIKRVSALALACVLVIAMGCPAFSANKEDSIALDKSDVEMKEFLTTRGFTEDYLDALIPQQLEILYQTCYSNDAYFLSVTKIPVAVPYGNISTDQLELEATYTYTPYVINGVTYMYEIHVMVNYDWIKVPMIKKADAISVNWDNTILTYNDNFKSYDYAYSDLQGKWITYKTWNAPEALNQGGLGIYTYIDYTYRLPSGEMNGAGGLKGTVTFSLTPEPRFSMSIAPGNNSTTINCKYVHDRDPLLGSLSFSYEGFSVSIDTGELQDSIADAARIDYTRIA